MTKFLSQTKPFLPMVIQKSCVESTQIIENHPSLSANILEQPKIEKETPIPVTAQKCAQAEDHLKIVIQKRVEECNILSYNRDQRRTLFQALVMDLGQLQDGLMLIVVRSQLWLRGRAQEVLRAAAVQGPGGVLTRLLWMEPAHETSSASASSPSPKVVQPETSKKTTPAPVSLPSASTSPKNSECPRVLVHPIINKREKLRLKSNLWETVVELAPSWQTTIALRLGALQQKVVEKLEK